MKFGYNFSPLFAAGVAYFLLVLFYLSPIPNGDDFDLILARAIALREADSPGEYLRLFFSRHNEHPCFIAALSSQLSMWLLGRLSVFFILLLSNLTLFAYLLQLAWIPARTPSKNCLSLALALIIFTPGFAELNVFASASIGLAPMLFFAALAFRLALESWVSCAATSTSRTTTSRATTSSKTEESASSNTANRSAIAITMAALSALSFAGGALALTVLSVFYALRRKNLWALISLFLFSVFVFFALSSKHNHSYSISKLLDYLLCLIGSAFGFNSGTGARFAGVSIVAALIFLPRKRFLLKNNTPDCLMFFFLILLSLAISWGRHFTEIESSFVASRYRIISLSMGVLIIKFYFATREITSRRKQLLLLALALCYSISSFSVYLPELSSRKSLLEDQALAMNLGLVPAVFLHPSPSRVQEVLTKATESGIYELPRIALQRALAAPRDTPTTCKELRDNKEKRLRLRVEQKLVSVDYLLLSGWAFDTREESQIILTVNNPSGEQSFSAKPRQRLDVYRPFRKTPHSDLALNSGFFLLLNRQALRATADSKYMLRLITAQGECFSRVLDFREPEGLNRPVGMNKTHGEV